MPAESARNFNYARCRICGGAANKVGEVEFYIGYRRPIFDCTACGCRYTLHDSAAYEQMYSEINSCYNRYIINAERCKVFFDRRDIGGLRAALSHSSRYRFIIDRVGGAPSDAKLLEIGCSRGHLTSYFLLQGRRVIGVDISPSAIAAASRAFGGRFVLATDPAIESESPYDVIYHVGTIGCTSDPIEMTEGLLRLLKPGGRLLFNAPNRESLVFPDQLWSDTAPPPDLVTLFPPGFWRKYLAGQALVQEQVELHTSAQSLQLILSRLTRRHWHNPMPMPLKDSSRTYEAATDIGARLRGRIESLAIRLAHATGLDGFVKRRPTEFGIFVEMTKV